jgi:hypothetical protein
VLDAIVQGCGGTKEDRAAFSTPLQLSWSHSALEGPDLVHRPPAPLVGLAGQVGPVPGQSGMDRHRLSGRVGRCAPGTVGSTTTAAINSLQEIMKRGGGTWDGDIQ